MLLPLKCRFFPMAMSQEMSRRKKLFALRFDLWVGGGLVNRRIQPLCHFSAACFQWLTIPPQFIWCTVGAQSFMASNVGSILFIAASTAGSKALM